MQQWYQCPRCRAPVAFGVRFCAYCGTGLNWQWPQPAPPPPSYQQPVPPPPAYQRPAPPPAYQYQRPMPPPSGYQQAAQPPPGSQAHRTWTGYQGQVGGYGQVVSRAEPRKASPLVTVFLGLIAVVFLIVGAFFLFRGLGPSSPGTPQYVQQNEPPPNVPAAPAQPEAPAPPSQPSAEYTRQFENRQPAVIGSHGNLAHLVNNAAARDVSFAQLKSFILNDPTSEKPYVEGASDCVDFAEEVHNNAELAGIKAAFVCVNFEGEKIGHALNAFETTDRGLAYIDCTGQGVKSISYTTIEGQQTWLYDRPAPGEYDKIAYIEKDKELGAISIKKAESLDYSYYVQYAENYRKLDSMIADYNSEVQAFKQALGGRTVLAGPEYSQFKAWEARIDAKKQAMLELANQLGAAFKPLGIVGTVDIYW